MSSGQESPSLENTDLNIKSVLAETLIRLPFWDINSLTSGPRHCLVATASLLPNAFPRHYCVLFYRQVKKKTCLHREAMESTLVRSHIPSVNEAQGWELRTT